MNVITDPLFYPLAIVAVTALGLGKGGFAGVGVHGDPAVGDHPAAPAGGRDPAADPVVQDAISVWVYRRDWSAWHLK